MAKRNLKGDARRRRRMRKLKEAPPAMAPAPFRLNHATVNFRDQQEAVEFGAALARSAGKKIAGAFRRQRAAGIVDERGNLIDDRLPTDMEPGTDCDLA